MEITIKTIRGIAVSNLIILGLAACSSSPAPWTQADDDPWGTHEFAATLCTKIDVGECHAQSSSDIGAGEEDGKQEA